MRTGFRARWARLGLATVAALALRGAAPARAGAPLVAERIDASDAARLVPGGPDATGGVGDWALSNGVLCAVVSDPAHESDLAVSGGALVDLGHCGRGDDQLVLLQPLVNLDRGGAVAVAGVTASVDGGEARLTTTGTAAGCDVDTVYSLDAGEPTRLRITSRIVRRAPGARIFAFGDIALHAKHALRPFALDTRGRMPAEGFSHPPLDLASPVSIARATRAEDTRLLVGARPLEPGIAYALRALRAVRERPGSPPRELPVLSLSAESFSGFAAFVAPFWLGGDRLGPLAMLETRWMDVTPGDTFLFEREVWVSDRSDAASLIDRLRPGGRRISGRVDDPDARLQVHADDGAVATEAAPDTDGRFAFRLAPGRYRLDVLGSASGETHRLFTVGDDDVDLGAVAAPPRGEIELPRGVAMRLSFEGIDGTPDPRFGDERPAVRFGGARSPGSAVARDVVLAGSAAVDPAAVGIAPGRYRVRAGRGPEYGVTTTEIAVVAGARVPLAIAPPPRVLATPGWISADLHVHAAPSDDSALPLPVRVASYVAEGCEVLVATDHDTLTDYGPLIRSLDLAGAVASVVGQEVTSAVPTPEAPTTFGHANVFPLVRDPLAYRSGALPNEGRRLRDVIAAVRALPGEHLVQLNHARSGGDAAGFFDHLSVGHPFEPDLPLTIPPNTVLIARDPVTGVRDVDFDAMELMNGPHMERYRLLRSDWFALLRHGIVRTGTANSDSHLLRDVAGVPRNLVRVAGDTPARFDADEFVRAIRAGRVIGTTGPILDLHVGAAGIGERATGRDAPIRVDVRAAPWVPVATVRVFVNGTLAHESPATAGATLSFPHVFDRDAFVTAEVEGAPDAVYAARLPGFTPFAFTNPVFVDADGDGAWTPPDPVADEPTPSAPAAAGAPAGLTPSAGSRTARSRR
jgi:hypothetical protein